MKQISPFARAALLLVLAIQIGRAAEGLPRIGVLRPEVRSESGGPPQTLGALMGGKIPPQARAAMASAVEQASAWKQTYLRDVLPPIVQRTWTELLALRELAALPLESASVDAARREAENKNVRWLLSTSVVATSSFAQSSPGGMKRGMPMGAKANASLLVTYSLVDTNGGALMSNRQASCSGELASESGSSGLGSGPDLWADCGRQIVKAIVASLPLSGVAKSDPSALAPAAPLMANSVRYDISSSEQSEYQVRGRRVPVPALGKAETTTLEIAGPYVMARTRGLRLVLAESEPVAYMIDDENRRYCTMSLKDMLTMPGSQPAQAEEPPRLVETGSSAGTREYTVVAPPPPANAYAGVQSSSQTTLSVEFGPPRESWKKEMETIAQRFGTANGLVASLGTEPAVSNALWQVLRQSEAPPRRILVRTTIRTQYGKTNTENVTTRELVFSSDQLARPTDFTFPAAFEWRSSPYLAMIWTPY